jgi:hypothetical protein
LVPLFHVAQGLYLQRQTNGDVRVLTTNGELPLATGANVKTDHTVEHQSWCRAVAFSSARGDTLESITAVEQTLRSEGWGAVERRGHEEREP